MISASALLLVLLHFCYVSCKSLLSVLALLLHGQARLCSVLRHFCQCYDTSVTWASMSLFNASALLLVLQHFCYVGGHISDQCFDTPASATTLLLRGQAHIVLRHLCSVLYHTFGYLLCYGPSHSVFSVYAGKYLYVVYMNDMIHEIKSTQLCSMIYTDKHLYDKNMNNEK